MTTQSRDSVKKLVLEAVMSFADGRSLDWATDAREAYEKACAAVDAIFDDFRSARDLIAAMQTRMQSVDYKAKEATPVVVPEAKKEPQHGREVIMAGVREYEEEYPVKLEDRDGRFVVRAFNEGGYGSTAVDMLDLVDWLRANKPGVLRERKNPIRLEHGCKSTSDKTRVVTKEEFDTALNDYPYPLVSNVNGIVEPPLLAYYDFRSGRKWPDGLVASAVLTESYPKTGESPYVWQPNTYRLYEIKWEI